MKKILSLAIVVIMTVISIVPVSAENNKEEFKLIIHENYETNENNLISESTKKSKVKVDIFNIGDDELLLVGDLKNYGEFELTAKIDNMEMSKPIISLVNLEVLCVERVADSIRIILVDEKNNDMIFIDYSGEKSSALTSEYNKYWFTKILTPEVSKEELVTAKSNNTSYSEDVNHVYNIYGDTFTETITISYYYSWPRDTDGDGEMVISNMFVDSKTTKREYSSGGSSTYDGNSLYVTGAKLRVGCDTGEYIENVKVWHVGTKVGSGLNVELSFWLDIPKVPAGISVSYNGNTTISQSSNMYYSFAPQNAGNEKATRIGLEWDNYKYRLVQEDDYFEGNITIKTDGNNALPGYKYLIVGWFYDVVTSGNNGGIAVPYFHEFESHLKFLHYTLN